jgi:hypothetical protein
MSGRRRAGFGTAGEGRHGLALLILLALLFRAAIPAGWMPDLQGADGAPLVICTGSGSEVVHLDRHGFPAKPHSSERHDVCAFAGIGSAPPTPAVFFGEPPRLPVVARLDPASEAALRPPPRYREQAARAPPSLI